MDTVEIQVHEPSSWRRLRSGALLLLIGGAAHLWVVPQKQTTQIATASQAANGPQRTAGVAGAVGTAGSALQQTIDKLAGAVVSQASAADSAGAGDQRPVRLIVRRIAPAAVFVETPPRIGTPQPGSVPDTPHVTGALRAAASSTSTGPAHAESNSIAAPADDDPEPADAGSSDPEGDVQSPREQAPLGEVVPAALSAPLARMPDQQIGALPAMATVPPSRVERTRTRDETLDGADEALVRQLLQQYRSAYERLDVAAAKSVWPTVDTRALSSAFRQLAGQRLTFESCGISVAGAAANARCRGQAEYLPKVGSRRAYLASGEWVFDLAKHDADWRIVNARVR